MPSKQQLDKAAWHWTETVDPADVTREHVEAAYRVKCTSCKANTCRRNCSGNPCCLSGLGERVWMQNMKDSAWHDVDDPNSERRPQGGFVGLKNLGATCYLNSFLQVWYHNPAFRQALYMWEPLDDPQEQQKLSLPNGDAATHAESLPSYTPTSVIGHLQLTFALLQFSKRRYIDPTPFINCLGLNAMQQQDAQEFSKLFISLVEDRLSSQKKESVRSLVQEQYSGEYSYVTKCLECSTESQRPSKFYELDLNIKGHKVLEQALNEFLQEEQLDGSNQYHCAVCGGKRNAVRRIQLQRLPPVLNLQLLRFVFDRTSGCKKKISSSLRFPEHLDLSKHLQLADGTVRYMLSAVLIHQGPSANSGHYVAHIKDRMSGAWFRFNDEGVARMPGSRLQLNNEDNSLVTGSGPAKQPAAQPRKRVEGTHESNGAYMLVYKRQGHDSTKLFPADHDSSWELPKYLRDAIAKDNEKFEEWVTELEAMRAETVSMGKARQSEVRALYEQLPTLPDEPFDWIPTEWLIKWLAQGPGVALRIDNSGVLCPHALLDPQKVSKMKCIRSTAADIIYEKFGGGPRLRMALCVRCVQSQCKFLKVKAKVQEDQKQISKLLKYKPSSEESMFWVGKSSLQHWKQLALRPLGMQQHERFSLDESNGNELTVSKPGDTSPGSDSEGSTSAQEENSMLSFNEDIRCPHGGLLPNESSRRLVGLQVWELLRSHFPQAPEFPGSSVPCELCQEHQERNLEAQGALRLQASTERQCLSELLQGRNRPSFSSMAPGDKIYLLPRDFIDQWKKFVRAPTSKARPQQVNNSALLCPHKKLLHFPGKDEDSVVLAWPSEWESLKGMFPVDLPITASKGDDPDALLTEPELCGPCSTKVLLERSRYEKGNVFVRRLTSQEAAREGAKRPRPDDDDNDASQPQRKSARRRRTRRGEREIQILASQTLFDLKVQVMHAFSVAPFDQNLSLEDSDGLAVVPLTDNTATLAQLGVRPGTFLQLKVDEPTYELVDFEDCTAGAEPEVGFKGTKLQE